MTDDPRHETPLERARRLKREQPEKYGAPTPEPSTVDPGLIPDLGPDTRSADDRAADDFLKSLDIVDAYRRWCGKMDPKVGSKTESIMVSCPNPTHRDQTPSAWLNSDKNVGMCPVCDIGFDVYDLYAWSHGFNVPGYKTDGTFPQLREEMAGSCGYVIRRTVGGTEYMQQTVAEAVPSVQEDSPPPPAGDTPVPGAEPLATVTRISGDEPVLSEVEQAAEDVPPIDWRSLLTDDSTFLKLWMETCCGSDLPDEYYFWLGLLALGTAVGNNVKLRDSPSVRTNLMVCMVGPSGIGKSRSIYTLTSLLRKSVPFDAADGTGTRLIQMPGSAEALVDEFNFPIYDPASPGVIVGYNPIRGLLDVNELSAFTSKATRQGSVLRPTLMQFYDSDQDIELKTRTHGLTLAKEHHCNVISTTQPAVMQECLKETDESSGFINRWMFVVGQSKQLHFMSPYINIEPCVMPLRTVRAWGGTIRDLQFDHDALKAASDFFGAELAPLKVNGDTATYARVDLMFKKLMLLLTVDKRNVTITKETVEQVISLWPYLKAVYGFGERAIMATKDNDFAEDFKKTVLEHCKQTKVLPSFRDVQRRMSGRFRRYNRDLAMKTLKLMIEMGEIEEEVIKPKVGRPCVRYRVIE